MNKAGWSSWYPTHSPEKGEWMGHEEFFGASDLFISGPNSPERVGLLLMNGRLPFTTIPCATGI
jgi:hypothetical protein